MTPLHIAVLGLSVWSLVFSLQPVAGDRQLEGIAPRLPSRTTAGYLLGAAGLFGLMWLSQIAEAILAGHAPAEVTRLGLVTNPVYTLDLALALPFFAVAGILLLRRDRIARAIGVAALSWSMLMGLGVLAIFAFDAAAGAAVQLAVVVLIGSITVAAAILLMIGLGPHGMGHRSTHLSPPGRLRGLHMRIR